MKAAERLIIREFLNALTREEESVRERLISDKLGIVLRTAINELDWFNHNYARQQEVTEEQSEHAYLMSLGVTQIVGLMLKYHQSFPYPALTFRRRNGPVHRVLEVVAQLGFIQHGRRIADSVFAGYSHISRGKGGRFEFVLPLAILDHSAIERDVDEHFVRETLRVRQEYMQEVDGRKLQVTIRDLHQVNVFVSREHFIGYDADPLLDEYYFQLAWSNLKEAPGFDSFNELREFGGIKFLKYTLAAAYVISLCLKHEGFCLAMKRKYPEAQIEDNLTISADREGFITGLCDALNLFGRDFLHYTTTTHEEAQQIYEAIAITRRNVELIDRAGSPLPCIIEFSDAGIIKFLSGRHRQMEFLLNSLRRSYSKEYDRHQQLREGAFQKAIEKLLAGYFPELEMRQNINLRRNGRNLTDVDLAVIDQAQGNLLLVQLKFQDRSGADFKVEASRMERFRHESVRWLGAVDEWLLSVDEQTIRSTFRVPRGVQIKRIRKMIIGRHHAWSLRSVPLDDDTTYATWNQLFNSVILMAYRQGDFRTLDGLHTMLRTFIVEAPDRHHRDEEPVEYVLDGLKFAISQVVADQSESSSTRSDLGS